MKNLISSFPIFHVSKSCGAGGSRTRVQTRKPYAFYMLIPALGFRAVARPGPPTATLSPKFHHAIGAWHNYSRFTMRRLILRFGTTPLERRLVPSPGDRIKPVIYCTSIRQREHTCCCQLIFWPNWLWSLQSSLRMLTYHLNLLSNPVNPLKSFLPENQLVKMKIFGVCGKSVENSTL